MKGILLHLLLGYLLACGAQVRTSAFGKEISRTDPASIFTAISEGYAAKHGLKPTDAELAPLRKVFGPPLQGGIDFPVLILQGWKLNRAWFDRYGGRLVLSSFGTHLATDAMLKTVEELEATGDVRFADAATRKAFFEHFQNYKGDGVVVGEKAKEILRRNPANSTSK